MRYLYLDLFPACSPVERVTPLKTLLWHPRLASVAIPKPYFPHCDIVCLFVCLSYMCLSNILMERTEDPIRFYNTTIEKVRVVIMTTLPVTFPFSTLSNI